MQFRNIGIGNVTVADFSRMNLAFADKTPFIKELFADFLNGAFNTVCCFCK